MTGTLVRFFSNRRGASAVEFALVAGPFALLMFGTVEFGRAYWARQALSEVAATSARCAAIPQPDCAVTAAYNSAKTISAIQASAAVKGLTLGSGDISINRAATCAGLSGFTVVTLTYTFDTALQTLVEPLMGELNFSASACFPTQA